MIIFAIDDEKMALEMLCDSIKEVVDETIYSFRKPSELLKEFEITTPDIVFMDVEMPGTNGVELAKKLLKKKNNINIIFVTGYSEYMSDAMEMFASGYVLKPVDTKQIRKQLEHLRYPISTNNEVFIKTFGNFTVYKGNEVVNFRYYKSKELLAYLVDRNGSLISRKELDAILMEEGNYSRSEQKMLSRYIKELEIDLEKAGISEIFKRETTGCMVDTAKFKCDLFDYNKGKKSLYKGEYMEEYSWGDKFKDLNYK